MKTNSPSTIEILLQKLFLYQKEIMIGMAVFMGFSILMIAFLCTEPSIHHYLKSEEQFAKWRAAPTDLKAWDSMIFSFRKTPALLTKYDGIIAQTLIGAGLYEKAQIYSNRAIQSLRREFPEHAAFASTTLLIEKGLYQEALERTISLKEQSNNPVLHAHNLMRVACLQKQLQNRPGEAAAWEDLEVLLNQSSDVQLSQIAAEAYKNQQIELRDYISERKAILRE